jgi:hypothetical protein
MFRRLYPWMFLLGGVSIGLVASGRIRLHAQDRGHSAPSAAGETHRGQTAESGPRATGEDRTGTALVGREPSRPGTASVQDILLRPFHFPFNRPTSLSQVCIHLKQTLGVSVVLDIAALGRQDVEPDDTVQLELDGVRFKTGLKLLLDQVGLTYHVVPEDNLLILTDRDGSDDPLDRIWSELRTLHRDLHDMRDAVDDLTDALDEDPEEGPRVRKPTIIEEKPEGEPLAPAPPEGEKKQPKAQGEKPRGRQGPEPRSMPSRVPLTKPGRSL